MAQHVHPPEHGHTAQEHAHEPANVVVPAAAAVYPLNRPALNRLAFSATMHCLTGCAIGETLGLVIASALRWHDAASIALAVVLAFLFGYGFSLRPLLKGGMGLIAAMQIAFAADTISITVMEIVDNAIMLLIPGAMEATISQPLFWGSLVLSLAAAFFAAYPVNRWLIARGRGHAVMHTHHH